MDPRVSCCAALFLGRGVASTVLEQTPIPESLWSFRLRDRAVHLDEPALAESLSVQLLDSIQTKLELSKKKTTALCNIISRLDAKPKPPISAHKPAVKQHAQFTNYPIGFPFPVSCACVMHFYGTHSKLCVHVSSCLFGQQTQLGASPCFNSGFPTGLKQRTFVTPGYEGTFNQEHGYIIALFKGVSVTAICAVTSW